MKNSQNSGLSLNVKNCKGCGPQPVEHFYTAYVTPKGTRVLKSKCKSCFKRSPKQETLRRRSVKISWNRSQGVNKAAILLRGYRNDDKRRGRHCDLTKDFIEGQLVRGCVYCGELDIRLLGLDRIDNALGHLKANVVPACERCNYIRRDMPYQAWLLFVPVVRKILAKGYFGDWYPRDAKNRKNQRPVLLQPDRRKSDSLSEDRILVLAEVFFRMHGIWPTSTESRPVPDKPKDSWSNYDRYLYYGNRGLPGGSSLAKLLQKERGVTNPKGKPLLTEDGIKSDLGAFFAIHGRYPTKRSTQSVPNKPYETWGGYQAALYNGGRGLPGGLSLATLVEKQWHNKG